MFPSDGQLTLCVLALYQRYGESFYGPQTRFQIHQDGDCLDLYDSYALCCCDGETVMVEDFGDGWLDVCNAEGAIAAHMILSDEQFEVATMCSADEARAWLSSL